MSDYRNKYNENTGLRVLTLAQDMTDEVYRLLTKQISVRDENGEKKKIEMIPKRTQWLYGVRLANKCDDLLDLIRNANALPTEIQSLMQTRTEEAYKAYAKAKEIAGSINDLQRRRNLSLEHFKNWARLYNIMLPPLKAWAESHKKADSRQ